MKQVLIIDDIPFFRDYIRDKMTAEKISVEISLNNRDGFSKMLSVLPDLLVYHLNSPFAEMIEFLEKKKTNPNAGKIPIIMYGPSLEKKQIATLVLYNVVKYFTKPVKIDIFYETAGKILHTPFPMDSTPCILEPRVNDGIIFIEIAKGLNREKLGLLKYKIPELIKNHNLINPKVIILMTDLTLSFIDGTNLELLLNNIIAEPRIKNKNIKVLSLDPFTTTLINGHSEYADIEIATNLAAVLGSLIRGNDDGHENVTELISNKFLQPTIESENASVQMRFNNEFTKHTSKNMPITDDNTSVISVALVSEDETERVTVVKSFSLINARVEHYQSAPLFSKNGIVKEYDLLIIDLAMSNNNGWVLLQHLRQQKYPVPIIAFSPSGVRQILIKAMSLGARGVLLKPVKAELLVQKAIELFNSRI